MTRAPRGPVQLDQTSALEDTIQDGGGQVFVMQNLSPFAEWLIGGEDHGSFSQVAIVDHVEHDVGGIGAVG